MTDPTDPTDETQPHPSPDPATPGPDAAAASTGPTPGPSPAASPTADPPPTPAAEPGPPLRANPDRPADSGWREPAWFPPRDRHGRRDHDRRPGVVALVVGLAMIAIGAYYFLDRTLGIAMPRISWSSLWPVALIVVGVVVLVQSLQRRT